VNQYDVLTNDNRHIVVFAESHDLEDGTLTLNKTHQGMYTDTFPEGYWSRYMVNGVEQESNDD